MEHLVSRSCSFPPIANRKAIRTALPSLKRHPVHQRSSNEVFVSGGGLEEGCKGDAACIRTRGGWRGGLKEEGKVEARGW